jgi:hypothetical protein
LDNEIGTMIRETEEVERHFFKIGRVGINIRYQEFTFTLNFVSQIRFMFDLDI